MARSMQDQVAMHVTKARADGDKHKLPFLHTGIQASEKGGRLQEKGTAAGSSSRTGGEGQ